MVRYALGSPARIRAFIVGGDGTILRRLEGDGDMHHIGKSELNILCTNDRAEVLPSGNYRLVFAAFSSGAHETRMVKFKIEGLPSIPVGAGPTGVSPRTPVDYPASKTETPSRGCDKKGVRDHGKGEGRDGAGQGKGNGQGPDN